MWIIVENTVILGIKYVLIEDLDHRKFMIYSNRESRSSHVCSDREKEVARIKRLGYSNINYINYIDYINYISLAKPSPKRKKYIKKEKGSPLQAK